MFKHYWEQTCKYKFITPIIWNVISFIFSKGDSSLKCSSHMRFCRATNLFLDLRSPRRGHERSVIFPFKDVRGQGKCKSFWSCFLSGKTVRTSCLNVSLLFFSFFIFLPHVTAGIKRISWKRVRLVVIAHLIVKHLPQKEHIKVLFSPGNI